MTMKRQALVVYGLVGCVLGWHAVSVAVWGEPRWLDLFFFLFAFWIGLMVGLAEKHRALAVAYRGFAKTLGEIRRIHVASHAGAWEDVRRGLN